MLEVLLASCKCSLYENKLLYFVMFEVRFSHWYFAIENFIFNLECGNYLFVMLRCVDVIIGWVINL